MTTYPIFCLTPSEKQNEFYHQFSDMAIEYLHKNHADILNRDVKSLADWPEKKRVEKPPVKEFEKPFKTELKKPAFPKKSAPVQENRPVPGNQLKQLIEDLKKKRAAERNY